MKKTLVFSILMLFFLAFASVSTAREYKVGVLYWSMNIPGQVAMRQGLEAEAERINSEARKKGFDTVKLEPRVAGDGEHGIENQISQMNEIINQNVDAIIVQPTDNAALTASLKKANSAGIPVLAYDQYISDGKLAAYRTSDNYQAGYLDGEYIASKFDDNKEIRIVLVEYPHVSSTVERVDGFFDALSQNSQKYRILKNYIAVEPKSGAKAGESMLADFPEKGSVDVLFTVNDGGGLAVVKKLEEAGRTEIMVATIDGDPEAVQRIAEGRMIVVDSAQYCGPLGAEAMRTAYYILRGEKPPYHALIPVFPVTKETINKYSGWQGPVSGNFIKPWKSNKPEWSNSLRIIKK